jgi:hypothetical protein
MPKTGDKCTQIGRYASYCGPEWIVHVRRLGAEFPPCGHCDRPVNYRYVGLSSEGWEASPEMFADVDRVAE